MDKDSTLSATDWFNEGLKCFNKPYGIAAVRAFEAVAKQECPVAACAVCYCGKLPPAKGFFKCTSLGGKNTFGRP